MGLIPKRIDQILTIHLPLGLVTRSVTEISLEIRKFVVRDQ